MEGDLTFRRIVELELDPVQGSFDAAHLQEINRRIFQDLPAAGFDDVTPGIFRPPTPAGQDWIKSRTLSTVAGMFHVAYSRMDQVALVSLDSTLQAASPAKMCHLKTAEFTERIAATYAMLDYVHPFKDGNSRTLRTFIKQLANESGYEIEWERFAPSPLGRDLLYIARDLSVNALAKPLVQHQTTLQQITYSSDVLEGNRDLASILEGVVSPSRAVAFEHLPQHEAIDDHPELTKAYEILATATALIKAKTPDDDNMQAEAIKAVRARIQAGLRRGEIDNF